MYIDATSFLTAIREALDSSLGHLRQIPGTRFAETYVEGADEEELKRRGTFEAKPFLVAIEGVTDNPATPSRMGNVKLIDVTIAITITRTADTSAIVTESLMSSVRAAALEDSDVISQSLCMPGNLKQTAAGTDTNIIGGLLVNRGSLFRMVGPATGSQRLETVHRFTGTILVNPATA